ncbi:MAG TPA: hypothetical protein VNG51_15210 [Ktedonobacteraceae bacterium]|nr:hypothetical protein [Ktedonobacteraceae bacterium]
MTTAGFLWPTKDEYDLAIARWQDTIFDPEVRGGLLAYDNMGICRFGGANLYVCIYKIGNWMVRCFCSKPSHAAPVDICERYMAIDRFCRKNANRVSALLPVTYLEQGIIVGSRTLPVVKMPFLTGCPSLGEFIMDNYTDRAIMQQLSDGWFRMIHELETAPMAHGDLDLSNVLVERGNAWSGLTLKLIDYDNMWMPELVGRLQTEYGHANFQHPDFLPPQQRPYNVEMDRFSALVMYISLKALTVHPELYDAWGADESDRLLLAESDYLDSGLVGSHIMQLRELCSTDMHPYIDELQSSLRDSRMPRSLYDLANANSSTFISYRAPTTPRLQPPPSFIAPVFKWSEAVYNANTNGSYPSQGQASGRGYATNYNGHTGQVQQSLQPVQAQNVAWNQGASTQSPAIIRSGQPTHQFPESDSGLTYPASWGPQNPPNSPFSSGSMPFVSPVSGNTPLPVMPVASTNSTRKIITIAIVVVLVLVIIAAGVALYIVLTGNHHIGPLSLVAGIGLWERRKRDSKGDVQKQSMGDEDGYPQGFNIVCQNLDGHPQGAPPHIPFNGRFFATPIAALSC